jgi:hypothetical protein
MESSRQNESEVREVRALVERIKRGDCVLVLGPRVAIRPGDLERTPLDERLAGELLESIGEKPAGKPANLRRAADLHYRTRKDRDELELWVDDFYRREARATTDFHRDLAALPFKLCVSASPDSLLLNAFTSAGKFPQKGYYSFRGAATPRLGAPTAERPMIYHLFGHHEDPTSLVLTEGDLIEFVVAVVRGTPAVPDQVRSMLADPAAAFLFIGFGFQNWYLRVLLQVMNVYGHRSKAIAFEDRQFFDHPDCDQAVGFFSGDRLIDFRPMQWDAFARQLRDVYSATLPQSSRDAMAERLPQAAHAPKVFVSYASEDRDAIETLAEQLESNGINVWQDAQDLRAGDNWNRVLLDVIERRVDYLVAVQTPAMTARIEGVFHREIATALQRQAEMGELDGVQLRFLIPIRIGRCPLLSVLSHAHVIDVDPTEGVGALVQSIQEDWQRRSELKSRARVTA